MKMPVQLLMELETRVTYGTVPRQLLDHPLGERSYQFRAHEFLLRAIGEHYFYYRRGCGIAVERGEGAEVSEEALWLAGSVYSAVACLNGLLPIHASAVAANGLVYAFNAPAGGGKSTVVAALGDLGFPMFCDDTLLLDLSDRERILCLPGHKRLKLQRDALEMTRAVQQESVSAETAKFYARPASGDVGKVLPLGELIYLEVGPEVAIEPIVGIKRFQMVRDDHYTAQLYATAHAFDSSAHFAHLAKLATKVKMARFVRPVDESQFEEGARFLANYLRSRGDKVRKLNERFTETADDDEVVIMRVDTGEFLSLTGTAAAAWSLIDGTRDRAALVSDLALEYSMDEGQVAAEVDEFLKQLARSGLLANA